MSAFCREPIYFSMTKRCSDTPNCICHKRATEKAYGKQEADPLVCVQCVRGDREDYGQHVVPDGRHPDNCMTDNRD